MITDPGIYVLRNPLRIVAAALNPDGQIVTLEYPLTPGEAASFAVSLARAASAECGRIEEFDREFLQAMKVTAES